MAVRRLSGPEVEGGRLVYTVVDGGGERTGEAALRPAPEGGGLSGDIPGQPAGSTVSYHFVLAAKGGAIRHPARSPGAYRFRVVPLLVLHAAIPRPDAGGFKGRAAVLRVEAASPSSGEMLLRRLGPSLGEDPAERVPLSAAPEGSGGAGSRTFLLRALLPDLAPGQLADLHFELRAGDSPKVKLPADAPRQLYTLKRPLRAVERLPAPSSGLALGVACEGPRRWAGLRGAGAVAWGDGPVWSYAQRNGLRSGIARFALPDPPSGQLYVGTDRGLTAIEIHGAAPRQVTGAQGERRRHGGLRAGPAALSTLDGTLLFQLEEASGSPSQDSGPLLFELEGGKLAPLRLEARGAGLLGLTTAAFDAVDGAWLLGGLVPGQAGGPSPVVLRRGRETVDAFVLREIDPGGRPAVPARVTALARDPSSGGLAAAVELRLEGTETSKRRTAHGVFIVGDSGELSPLAPELEALEVEVTSLAADWQRGELLVGTFGLGLFRVRGGAATPHGDAGGAGREITALALDGETGAVVLGTPRGAFEIVPGDGLVPRPGAENPDAVPLDALPVDAEQRTGRVLLSSYASGLVELARREGEAWRVVRRLRPGEELPPGHLGDARYLPGGGIAAILHSRGLLLVEEGSAGNTAVNLLGPEAGLRGTHLLRVLPRASGEIWVTHTPLPFGPDSGASLQAIRGGRVVRTVEIPGRNLATIGALIEWPERGSVLAATRSGAAEVGEDGGFTLLSREPAAALAREPGSGALGLAGAALERWEGGRFRPVLFQVDHPRWPRGRFTAGSPIDLAIDRRGVWHLLFRGGVLALLDPSGSFLGLLDPEDGIPPSAQKLLANPATGEVLIGSAGEGVVVVGPGA